VTDAPAGTNSGTIAWLRARPWRAAAFAALGGFIAIGLLGQANAITDLALLIAPFGASCALVFGAPASPLAHPRNVIGGHLVAAFLGLVAATLVVSPVLAMAVGVGLAIAGMLLTGTLHPPAGANPIVVVLGHATWGFLLMPVLAGTLVIVAIGIVFHRLITGHDYAMPARR
jgi:CBS-domain-containing membrane protein